MQWFVNSLQLDIAEALRLEICATYSASTNEQQNESFGKFTILLTTESQKRTVKPSEAKTDDAVRCESLNESHMHSIISHAVLQS